MDNWVFWLALIAVAVLLTTRVSLRPRKEGDPAVVINFTFFGKRLFTLKFGG